MITFQSGSGRLGPGRGTCRGGSIGVLHLQVNVSIEATANRCPKDRTHPDGSRRLLLWFGLRLLLFRRDNQSIADDTERVEGILEREVLDSERHGIGDTVERERERYCRLRLITYQRWSAPL